VLSSVLVALEANRYVKSKGKVRPITGQEDPKGDYIYCSTLSLTSALDGSGWLTPRPGLFTPGRDPVPIVQEAGWAPGPIWTVAENLAPAGILSPDHPARSPSLQRLRYHGHAPAALTSGKILCTRCTGG
jgi:hypothetical protein